jgi:hypothetical protein
MQSAQVVTVSIAAIMCAVAIGTVLWRLATTVERVSLLVERLARDLDAQGTRISHIEATRPSDAAIRASLDAMRVQMERDALVAAAARPGQWASSPAAHSSDGPARTVRDRSSAG